MDQFGKKSQQQIDDYNNTLSGIQLYLLGGTELLFPEEISWLLVPKELVEDITLSMAFAYGKTCKSFPAKIEEQIWEEISKQSLVSGEYAHNYLRFWELANTQFLKNNPNPTSQESANLINYSAGKFICSIVSSWYKENGQEYDFSLEFACEVGSILTSVFNKALESFEEQDNESMLYQKEFRRILILTSKIIDAHIENHNNLFNKSIFSIFKKVKYSKYTLISKELEREIILFINELNNIIEQGSEADIVIAKVIIRYLKTFKKSIDLLILLSEKLQSKSEGGTFNLTEYNQLFESYEQNEFKRTNIDEIDVVHKIVFQS